ncbi:MAG: tetratricopeptide repeat protein [Chloroflexota bacterium]
MSQGGRLITAFHSAKAQALLCYLAVTGCPHTRSSLTGLLWAELPEENARLNLRKVLSNLRKLAGDQLIITRHEVAFNKNAPYWLDVAAFEQAVSAPKSNRLTSETDISRLAQAMDLYQGDFLADFYLRRAPEFEAWVLTQQARLRALALRALQTLATYYTQQQQYETGIETAKRWLALDPFDEEAHRQLMRLLALQGQRSAALAHYKACQSLFRDEYGIDPGEETQRLYETIRRGELDSSPKQPAGYRAAQLPPQKKSSPYETPTAQPLPYYSTPFVGRQSELQEIVELLHNPHCRLLTLGGLSGIGKTRLAVQAVKALPDHPSGRLTFSDGVVFVPLAAVDSADLLGAAIAEAMNFTFYSDISPQLQLLNTLRGKRLLLVLDSFEYLLAGVDLIAEILRTAPTVKFLVTSTETLNLQEEWFFPLAGLSFPDSETAAEAALERYDAVHLFAQIAQRARVGFSLAEEKSCVIRICRLLEGMPLGLELAAAWLRTLSCEQVAQEIEQGLDFLVTSAPDVPDRHRSIRAVFDQSWNQLSKAAREVLSQLSVFQGGFRREAAEQITGTSLFILSALVAKSFIHLDPAGRYQIHELLRRFAAEKLRATPKMYAITARRHQDYYLAFLEQREAGLRGKWQRSTLAEIGAEIENVRAGWDRALTQPDMAAIDRSYRTLYHFYQIRSWFQEGAKVFGRAAAHLQTIAPNFQDKVLLNSVLAKILARQGAFHMFLGDYPVAEKVARQSLALARSLATQTEIAFSLYILGYVAYWQGRIAEAKQFHQESLSISREMDDPARIADALTGLGETTEHLGGYTEAKRYFSESLSLNRDIGRQNMIAYALDKLGAISFYLGEYAESRRYYQESLALFREIEDRLGMAMALGGFGLNAWGQGEAGWESARQYLTESLNLCRETGHQLQAASRLAFLGRIANSMGEYDQAQHYCQEGLAISRQLGNPVFKAMALNGLGQAACGQGALQTSRRYLLEALATATTHQIFPQVLESLAHYAALTTREGQQNETARLAKTEQAMQLLALVLHHPASWQIIKTMAANLLAELIKELPDDVASSAQRRGQEKGLEETVQEILGQGEHRGPPLLPTNLSL